MDPHDFVAPVRVLLIFCLCLTVFSNLWSALPLTVYQSRDIQRAFAVLSGSFFSYGPELSGGGFLPGGFYYYLLSLPLLLSLGWASVWWEMLILASAALVCTFRNLVRITSSSYGYLMLALFIFSRNFMASINVFMNPSFLPLFIVLISWSSIKVFVEEIPAKRQEKHWYYVSLLTGLGLQLHFTMIFIWAALLALYFFSRHLRLRSLPTRVFLKGSGLFLLTLVPYGIWTVARHSGVHYGPSAKNFGGVETEASVFLFRQLLLEMKAQSVSQMVSRMSELFFIPQIACLGLSSWFTLKFFPPGAPLVSRPSLRGHVSVLGILLFATLFPSIYPLLGELNLRYTLPFCTIYPVFFVCVLFCCDQKFGLNRSVERNTIAALLYLLYTAYEAGHRTLALAPATYSLTNYLLVFLTTLTLIGLSRFRKDISLPLLILSSILGLSLVLLKQGIFTTRYLGLPERPTIDEMRLIGSTIRQQTGWNYEEARRHIFYVNKDYDIDFQLIESFEEPVRGNLRGNIDGYFVGLIKPGQTIDRGNLLPWLRSNRLAQTVVEAIESGALRLHAPEIFKRVVIISYDFPSVSSRIDFLHNHGFPYDYRDDFKFRSGMAASRNDCPGKPSWCSIHIQLTERTEKTGDQILRVEVTGVPISQPSEWIVPDWTSGLIDPKILIACGSSRHSLVLAKSLGFSYDNGLWTQNHSLLAPLSLTFPNPCRKARIDSATFVFEDAKIASVGKYFRLGKQELVLSRLP